MRGWNGRDGEDSALECVAVLGTEDTFVHNRRQRMSKPLLQFRPKPEVAEIVRVLAAAERRTVSNYVANLVEDVVSQRKPASVA